MWLKPACLLSVWYADGINQRNMVLSSISLIIINVSDGMVQTASQ